MVTAGKFQIKVVALPLIHCVGVILHQVQYIIFESYVLCHVPTSVTTRYVKNTCKIAGIFHIEFHERFTQKKCMLHCQGLQWCLFPAEQNKSMPEATSLPTVLHVFAFMLEKQEQDRKDWKYNGFKQEGNIIWCNSYKVCVISNKNHFSGLPDHFMSYNKD